MASLLVASSDSSLRDQIRRLLLTSPRLVGASILEARSAPEMTAALASGTLDVAIFEATFFSNGVPPPSQRTRQIVLSQATHEVILREEGRTIIRHPAALNRLVEEVERLLPAAGPKLDPAAEIEASFRALRRDYLSTLPERILELRQSIVAAKTGDKPGLENARRIFHQVRGTGASFGMPELTDAAGRGETALIELSKDPSVTDRWTTVDASANEMEALAAKGVTEPA